MKYTVTDVTTSHILVILENGSTAQIQIQKGWDKDRIEEEISKYIPNIENLSFFDKVSDVPISVGETKDLESYGSIQRKKNETERKNQEEYIKKINSDRKELKINELNKKRNRLVDYKELRQNKYPSISDQLDALYWSRVGISTHLEEIDKKIKLVKEKYPKDLSPKKAIEIYPELKKTTVMVDGEEIEVPVELVEN